MRKLLAANIVRMKKNKLFWLGILFMVFMGIIMPIIRYTEMNKSGLAVADSVDKIFFAYVLFVTIISSAFCSLFVGTEYSDGTMRNKAAVGHTRAAIYLSNLIVCIIADIIMCAAFILPVLCVGVPLLGGFEIGLSVAFSMIACSLLTIIATTAIFIFVSLMCSNKAITAIICTIGIFSLLISGVYINAKLNQPEMVSGYEYTQDGKTTTVLESENPDYLRGTERKVYEFLYDFSPGGQVVQFFGMSAKNLVPMTLYSFIILITITGAGLFLFKKKDLK